MKNTFKTLEEFRKDYPNLTEEQASHLFTQLSIINELDSTVNDLNSTVNDLNSKLNAQEKAIKDRDNIIAKYSAEIINLREMVKLAKERHDLDLKKLYGASSEKRGNKPSKDKADQIINEPEKTVDDDNKKKRKRGPNKNSKQERNDFDDPDEEIVVDDINKLPDGDWIYTGKDIIVKRIETRTSIKKVIYRCPVYQHKDQYDLDGRPLTCSPGYDSIERPKSIFGSSLIANIIYSRYRLSLPLYRFEKMLEEHNIHLSRVQLSRETLRVAYELEPFYNLMLNRVRQGVGYVDGTGWQAITTNSSNKRCNIIVFANRSQNLATYIYTLDKSKETMAREVFGEGYQGYAHCDAAPEWLSISVDKGEKVRESEEFKQFLTTFKFVPILCWYHVRRKFIDAKKDKRAQFYLDRLSELARIERSLTAKKANFEIIRLTRAEKSKPVVDQIFEMAKRQIANTVPKSLFNRALSYLIDNESGLRRFLENGEFAISNNYSERLIKNVVIGRKNSLFSYTDSGAKGSCILYSIVVSAYLNGLDVLNYLEFLITNFNSTKLSALPTLLPNAPEMLAKFKVREPIDMNSISFTEDFDQSE